MSLLSLLLIASLVGAVAFFLAGLLLAPGRGRPAPASNADQVLATLRQEVEAASHARATAEAALAEAKARCQAEETGRKHEQQGRATAELKRDQARAEAARIAAEERVLTARVRELEGARAEAATAIRERVVEAEHERAELQGQLDRTREELAAAVDEQLTLQLRVTAAEEITEQRRIEALTAVAAKRAAEERIADRDRLAQENTELREQRDQAERDGREQSSKESDLKDSRVELATAQAKLAELALVQEENRRLRDEAAELRTHQEASGELERLTAAHKRVRLDAELMARRLQELLHDQAELVPLRAQAAEAASLAEEVEYLRRREKNLEAQIYAGGSFSSREMPALSGELLVAPPGSDMETNLSALVGSGGPRTAVLADAQGFLIAGAGESVAQEGLAAFAAVAGEMVNRARMLLPLAQIDSLRVTDANRMVLTCHLFSSAGEALGVATLGPGEPKVEETARAIAGLAAIVAGTDLAADVTPEPAT